jgi:hypothetical protein
LANVGVLIEGRLERGRFADPVSFAAHIPGGITVSGRPARVLVSILRFPLAGSRIGRSP